MSDEKPPNVSDINKKKRKNESDLTTKRRELGTARANVNVDDTSPTQREAMLKAWAAGWTFQEIADHWGYKSAAFCRVAIERALAESDVKIDRERERERFRQSLLMHHREASMHALDSDDENQIAWMRMDLLIIERIARLLGLDAPTQIVLTPGAEEFEKLTTFLAIQQGADTTAEADPMGT
jgi:hypothetical protein